MVCLLTYTYFGKLSFHVIAMYLQKFLKFFLLIKTAADRENADTAEKDAYNNIKKNLNTFEKCTNIS